MPPDPMLADFEGLSEFLTAVPTVAAAIAFISLVPASRGRWWTWLILIPPFAVGLILTLDLIRYSDGLSLLHRMLFPLPLVVSTASVVLWMMRRRARAKHPSVHDIGA